MNTPTTPIQIETGIPIPPPSCGKPKGELRLAFEKLKKGDSILIPRDRLKPNALTHLAKVVGIKIAQRQVNCESRRIWRVK